jgi:3,4-dihydroxy-2-butanone 4-phosphate synthase
MMSLLILPSGLVCLPIAGERLDQLQIPLMVPKNTEPHRTAFTVSVDYKEGKELAFFS